MTGTGLVPVSQPDEPIALLVQRVLAATRSPETRRAYETALRDFIAWSRREGKGTLEADLVVRYRDQLTGSGSTIAVKLAAIKQLAQAAALAGLISASTVAGIASVKGPPRRGTRMGNWLTLAQVKELLAVPDRETLKGKRDYAVLACLIGCGLRRAELVGEVTVKSVSLREGRWVLADLVGKGGRFRSVAVPGKVKQALDEWLAAAHISDGPVFRAVRKNGMVWGAGLTPGAVLQIVQQAAAEIGVERLAPHDLRRTCAKLCRKRGGDLEQIQFLLGHASISTTERYLGAEQELVEAVNDDIL